MNRKIVFLILSIMGIITIILGSTYSALFRSNITEKNVYNTGVLEITSSNNGNIALNNTLPLTDDEGTKSFPYVFTLKNTGNLNYKLTSIKLVSTSNSNQISAQYIKVKLDDRPISILNNLSSKDYNLLNTNESITIFPGDSFSFSLRVWLDDFTPNTQIGKVFNAKIVTQGEAVQTSLALNTITKLGLESSLKPDTPDFSKTSCSSGCEENTVGIYKAEDDLGDSYYFRGDVTNNYVKFAGFYWRIVRINGDGTIRLIYDGTKAYSNGNTADYRDRRMGKSPFNSNANSNAYVGYKYGNINSNSYMEIHENLNESSIKKFLENWYRDNIFNKGFDSFVSDSIYCNDRRVNVGSGIGTVNTEYEAYFRRGSFNPNLECTIESDKFTFKNGNIVGNDKLNYPIGLLTADEIMMAGSTKTIDNNRMYLVTSSWFWSMSPARLSGGNSRVMLLADFGKLGHDVVTYSGDVRGVISLKQDALNSGTGTSTDPFTYNPSKGTLKRLGLDTQVRTDVPDFSKSSCSSGCDEKTVGIYKAPDDLGDSYYFRGDVTNNYVKFAGFYWRIVRINGDGTIRLIYDGTSAHPNGESSTDREIGKSAFNSTYNDPKYVGYMYDANISSTIKGVVDNWYKTNILDKGYGSSVADAIYCNDTSPEPFSAYGRIWENKGKEAILTCPQDKDKYTVIKGTIPGGNGKLTYPAGLITADEMIMAGYPVYNYSENRENTKLYLYTGSSYWSASPQGFYNGRGNMFLAFSNVNGGFVHYIRGAVRVSVSLNSTVIKSGSGTASDPFVV